MTAPVKERIALFGGSFDPPHVGHVLAASWVLATADIDKLWVIPAYDHAFDKELTSFEHRQRMVELAFAHLRGVTVSDVEKRMGGQSYTVLTLARLAEEHPEATFLLMVGTDLVKQIPTWHRGHRIPELAELLVVGRSGHDPLGLAMPEVSSTEVRHRLRTGVSASSLVPHQVLTYIEQHGLYAP